MTAEVRQLPEIEVIPKVESSIISTGNILRWNRMRTYTSSLEEMKCELQATTAGWWLKQDEERLASLQYINELFLRSEEESSNEKNYEGCKYIIKIFLQNPNAKIQDAIEFAIRELGIDRLDTVVLSMRNQAVYPRVEEESVLSGLTGDADKWPPAVTRSRFSKELISRKWSELCSQVKNSLVAEVGCCDLTLSTLESFDSFQQMMPSLYQLSRHACCEGAQPPELRAFLENHGIATQVHDDPEDVISDESFVTEILAHGSPLGARDRALWRVQWLIRWTAVDEQLAVVRARGYCVAARRNVRSLHKHWT